MYTKNALSFRCTLMILHLSRMRRNVNRKVDNDRKHVSATAPSLLSLSKGILTGTIGRREKSGFKPLQ